MTVPESASSRSAAGTAGAFFLLAAVLIFAPLFRAGNRPLPLLFLELAALALAAHALWQPAFKAHLSRPFLAAFAFLFLFPLLQLFPIPAAVWQALPGHGFYAEALARIGAGPSGPHAPSLIPMATEASWLALLPPLAVFLVAVGLPSRQLSNLVKLFLWIAVFEALLGLIQYGDGQGSPFYLGNPFMAGSAAGTYINRNNLAGLLEMALPLGLALLAATVGHSGPRRHHRRGWRQRLAGLASLRVNRAAIYGFAALAVLLGLIFTRSRAGVTLAMLGIFLSALAFSLRLGGKNVYGLVGTFIAVAAALAAEIGLAPVLDRFTLEDPGRWSIFASTLQATGQFFPLGSGMGTFPHVYPRFQPDDLSAFINRAHNDYLEWLMEGGILAAVLIALFLWFYLRQWPRVWVRGGWHTFRFIQVAAGISLLLLMLHSLVDFNLHIPANAVYFAFLAAVFMHRHREEEAPAHRHEPSPAPEKIEPRLLPPQNVVNPFAQ